jgi:phosphoribosylformimino-5-aminoimidazole carboxamide ribotide isomerase
VERIPAIDLLGGAVVRLREGRFDAATSYGDDPLHFARSFQAAGARRVHLVDLDAARGERPFTGSFIAPLCALGLAVQAAGGVRTPRDAELAFRLGADRVVVGSAAADPKRLAELLALAGPERIAVALDVRQGRLAVAGWQEETPWTLRDRLRTLWAEGVRRVVYTAVERDGTLAGPDWKTVAELRAFPFHLTVAGGVARAEDLAGLAEAGVDAVIIGRALYEGTLSLEEALAT